LTLDPDLKLGAPDLTVYSNPPLASWRAVDYAVCNPPRAWRWTITTKMPSEEAMQSQHAVRMDLLDTQTPEERLRALGIELPPAAPPVGDYLPTIITGNLLFMSGQVPWIAGDLKFKGKMGAELNIEQGYQAFRLSALNAIAQLKKALGSLDRVKQIIRLEGTMGCAPGFQDQPKVLDGASHVVNQVFGPRGRHTRMVYSNNEMPMDCATLVVLTTEIFSRERGTRFSDALWS
jgi:enamine deaminase RidA (YjgF/YER057c/UK114 family)